MAQIVERGLAAKDGDSVADSMPKETVGELHAMIEACLDKAGLVELNAKLKQFQASRN